jgi:hypothetical protein
MTTSTITRSEAIVFGLADLPDAVGITFPRARRTYCREHVRKLAWFTDTVDVLALDHRAVVLYNPAAAARCVICEWLEG